MKKLLLIILLFAFCFSIACKPLPPGQAKKKNTPPGLMKKGGVPPGQQKKKNN
ncbi:hypothetical protein [Thermoflexibacter ruber]|uniref:Lipoprotein n=1 Tax=Thermoflexibacter ruber TaxID=1003 RepID=A0A1I2J6L4_9BACT|nr:hypothetical protein [Thermoflexibacter ruber]SFF49660.1 hypothetical protein SAMN04488541_104224 [Thermoflexibacter ruber]